MKAAAFTDCVYIPFADSVCSLPGPINITVKPTVKNAGSGIKTSCIMFIRLSTTMQSVSLAVLLGDANPHISKECRCTYVEIITSIQPFLCF